MDLPTTRYDKAPSSTTMSTEKISENISSNQKESIPEKVSFLILLAVIFLTPLVFLPSQYVPIEVVKMTVISLGSLAVLILAGIGILKTKSLALPKGPIVYATAALLLSVIISTFSSVNTERAFISQGFDLGTTSTILLMFLISFFIARFLGKKQEKVFSIYAAILFSFIVIAILHIVRLLGGSDILTLGFLSSSTSTLLGRWFDLSIMSGVVGLLSLLALKFLSLGKGLKIWLSVLLVLCGVFLFLTNFSLAWWAIAIVALVIGIFEFKSKTPQGEGVLKKFFSRISFLSLVVLVIAVVFAVNQDSLRTGVTDKIGITYGESVLPWQLTLDVTADSLKEAPLFGAGPNHFVNQFLRFKPQGINLTPLWNAEFRSGFGTIPSFVTTQGLVGLVVWVIFFIFFIKSGISMLKSTGDQFKKFLITSSFFVSAFLWLMQILYIPSSTIQFLTFVFTGVFFASLSSSLLSWKELKASARSNKYFLALGAMILVVLVVWLGAYAKRSMALAYFHSGIRELNTSGSIEISKAKFAKALSWNKSDVYYQTLSQVNLIKVSGLVQQIQANATPDQKVIDEILALINEAVAYTQKAIEIDPYNYYNHLAQAQVLETANSIRVPNAYENAKTAYTNAILLNPYNPGLYLNLARLEVSQNKLTEAQQFIGRALSLKQNYIEAIFLLSQIQVTNGQIKDAITSAQVTTQINPKEPLLFFQLGFLHYNDRNYTEAAKALTTAVELNNQYANARYFLGLSNSRLGKNAEAIQQFEELVKTNPDNQEVRLILSNLRAGKSPFADATPPIDSKPEKRKTLPVDEKQNSSNSSKGSKSQATN